MNIRSQLCSVLGGSANKDKWCMKSSVAICCSHCLACANDTRQLRIIAGIVIRMHRVTLLQKRQSGTGEEETELFETMVNMSYMKKVWLKPIASHLLVSAEQSGHSAGARSHKRVSVEVSREQLQRIKNTEAHKEQNFLVVSAAFLSDKDAAFKSQIDTRLAQIVIRAPSQEDFPSI